MLRHPPWWASVLQLDRETLPSRPHSDILACCILSTYLLPMIEPMCIASIRVGMLSIHSVKILAPHTRHTNKETQTHTNTHKHTQTQTQTHKHKRKRKHTNTQTHTISLTHTQAVQNSFLTVSATWTLHPFLSHRSALNRFGTGTFSFPKP